VSPEQRPQGVVKIFVEQDLHVRCCWRFAWAKFDQASYLRHRERGKSLVEFSDGFAEIVASVNRAIRE
jgi:hypothetical protein